MSSLLSVVNDKTFLSNILLRTATAAKDFSLHEPLWVETRCHRLELFVGSNTLLHSIPPKVCEVWRDLPGAGTRTLSPTRITVSIGMFI